MPDLSTLLVFMGAGLALNLTPGPDMLYVAARSAAEGRGAGFASALGITGGGLLHTVAAALGLSGLLLAVPLAYDAVRYIGAAYLVYLGLQALLARPVAAPPLEVARADRWAVFRQGVVTNVLNPKVALFFLAFLPQFVDQARGPVALQMVLLGLLFNTTGTLVNLGVAVGASGAGGWSRRRLGASPWPARLSGAVFVGLGVRLALMKRP